MKWHQHGSTYQIRLDLMDFCDQSISLIAANGILIIRALREEEVEDGGFISHKFDGRLLIPKHANVDTIKAYFVDGHLIVNVDQTFVENRPFEKIIPIFPANPIGHKANHLFVGPGI